MVTQLISTHFSLWSDTLTPAQAQPVIDVAELAYDDVMAKLSGFPPPPPPPPTLITIIVSDTVTLGPDSNFGPPYPYMAMHTNRITGGPPSPPYPPIGPTLWHGVTNVLMWPFQPWVPWATPSGYGQAYWEGLGGC